MTVFAIYTFPNTTGGVLINEGYDRAVAKEIEVAFDRLVPVVVNSKHDEGNSDSHIKTALGWIVAITVD